MNRNRLHFIQIKHYLQACTTKWKHMIDFVCMQFNQSEGTNSLQKVPLSSKDKVLGYNSENVTPVKVTAMSFEIEIFCCSVFSLV